MTDRSAIPAPRLEIINKDATPEEVAAIVAVLSALQVAGEPERAPASHWAHPARRMRQPHHHGAWRASTLPG